MKSFLKRNSPVFIVGMITLLIFLFIIAASQGKENQTPELQEINTSELIAPHTYTRGTIDAPVTLVMFCDFNEPRCAEYYPYVTGLYQSYSSYLRIAFRHYAPRNKTAAIAAQVSGEQNRFWEFIEAMFYNMEQGNSMDNILQVASNSGLNIQMFEQDLNRGDYESIVDDDTKFAKRVNIDATPAFFLNGSKMEFKSTVDFRDQVEEKIKELMPQNISNNTTTNPPIIRNPETKEEIDLFDTLDPQRLEESKQTLEIFFDGVDWEPKKVRAYPKQLVRWTNNSSETVKLVQVDQKFPEFKTGIEIPAGGSFEFRLYKEKLWRYRDEYTKKWGQIFIMY